MRVTVDVLMGGESSVYSVQKYEFTDVVEYRVSGDCYNIVGTRFGVKTEGYFPKSRSIVLIT